MEISQITTKQVTRFEFWVRITANDHPHFGKRGYVEVIDGKITVLEMKKGDKRLDLFTVNFEDGTRGMANYSDCTPARNYSIFSNSSGRPGDL